jgi:hypothetical protein
MTWMIKWHAPLFDNLADYFAADDINARLTRSAALQVCKLAHVHGRIVSRIEGGIERSNGIEWRLDALWSGGDPPMAVGPAGQNNAVAGAFIAAVPECDVFMMMVPPSGAAGR